MRTRPHQRQKTTIMETNNNAGEGREENAKLKRVIEDIRNVCTSENESKDRFIRRVLAILGPANAGSMAATPEQP